MPPVDSTSASPDRPSRENPALSIVMPCYNEAEHIEETLKSWVNFIPEEIGSFEIIVVNDGSMDGTGRVLDKVRKELPCLRVIHQLNGGPQAAVKRGFESARGEYILQTESNGRFEPSDLAAFWEHRKEHALLIARRVRPFEGWLPQAYRKLVRGLVKTLFGAEWQEPHTPFRLILRSALEAQLVRLPRGFDQVNLGLTLLFHDADPASVAELPVPYRFRSGLRRRPSFLFLLGTLFHTATDLAHLKVSLLKLRIPSVSAAEPA
jgi:glycosyltransferase involved in cell wall biosynthesis